MAGRCQRKVRAAPLLCPSLPALGVWGTTVPGCQVAAVLAADCHQPATQKPADLEAAAYSVCREVRHTCPPLSTWSKTLPLPCHIQVTVAPAVYQLQCTTQVCKCLLTMPSQIIVFVQCQQRDGTIRELATSIRTVCAACSLAAPARLKYMPSPGMRLTGMNCAEG